MADDKPINLTDLATNGRLLLGAVYAVQQAILSTFPRISGSFTLTAGATTTVSNKSIAANSIVLPFASNASAATLMGGAKSLYHDMASNVAGVSFTMKTANGVAATGAETFNYIIITPA